MGAEPVAPHWFLVTLFAAAVSAIVSLISSLILAIWTGSQQKLRKYEELLVEERLRHCNLLLQLVNELCVHLSPVAKGTTALGPGDSEDGDEDREIKRTFELRRRIYEHVSANTLYLGREVCLSAIRFDCGFEELDYLNGLHEGEHSHLFYALCHWTWRFEDEIKEAVRQSLREATFSLPSSLDIGGARAKGYEEIKELMEAIKGDPRSYSIDARNRELRQYAATLKLP